jgi:hypothetical protein
MHRLLPINVQLSSCPISGIRVASFSVLFSRSDLLWLIFVHRRSSLISALLDPSNGLNVPAVCLALYKSLKRDCFGNQLSVGF